MAVVYRKTDKIPVKVDDIEIDISPLGYHEKNRIQGMLVTGKVESLMEGATLALKCGIKAVRGVQYSDGSKFELKLDENNQVSDESLDELMNLGSSNKLSAICLSLIDGIPNEFTDPQTGEVLEGVKIIREERAEKKD